MDTASERFVPKNFGPGARNGEQGLRVRDSLLDMGQIRRAVLAYAARIFVG